MEAARELMRRGNHFAARQEWGSAMTMFQDAANALPGTASRELRSYTLAHLADATVHKLVGMYRMNQVLSGAAIPALQKVEQEVYEEALALNPSSPWAWAHRGELHRLIANCVLDEHGNFTI